MIALALHFSEALSTLGGYVLASVIGFAVGVWAERKGTMKRNKDDGGFVSAQVMLAAISVLAVACVFALVYVSIQAGQAAANNTASRASVAAANHQIDELQHQTRQNEIQADCQQRALEHLIAALLPRSSFAEQEAEIQLVYARRQLAFLLAVDAGASGDKALRQLVDASRVRIKALNELLDSVASTSLPSLGEIEACRN